MTRTRTTTTTEWGDGLPPRTGPIINDLKSRRTKPTPGTRVRIVAIPGAWIIWSPGPSSSSWLKPADADAITANTCIQDAPADYAPIIQTAAQSMVAVGNQYLRTPRSAA